MDLNKKYCWVEYNNGVPVIVTMTVKEILEIYWYDWCYNQFLFGNDKDSLNKEQCLNDFIIKMRASEVNDDDHISNDTIPENKEKHKRKMMGVVCAKTNKTIYLNPLTIIAISEIYEHTEKFTEIILCTNYSILTTESLESVLNRYDEIYINLN